MDKQTAAALERLHTQLQNTDSLDEQDQHVVEQLRTDVQAVLAHSGEAPAPGLHSVRSQLESAIQRFEVSHPEMTSVMAAVVDSLASIGF